MMNDEQRTENWERKNPVPVFQGAIPMDKKALKAVLTEIFAELAKATASRPFLQFALHAVEALLLSRLENLSVTTSLQQKGLLKP
jgi:hypothetical protein